MQLIDKWPSHCALSPPRHSPSGHASCWLLPAYDQAEQGCLSCPFPGRCGTPLLGNFDLKTPPRPDQIFWELHCHVRLFPSDSSSFPPYFRVRSELYSEGSLTLLERIPFFFLQKFLPINLFHLRFHLCLMEWSEKT